MHASESAAHDLRRRASEVMGGAQPEVAEWEVAIMHRKHAAHDGCATRVSWSEGDPARADDNVSTMRTAMLPKVEEVPGFCSLSLFINRETGRGAIAATYDSRPQMEQATDRAIVIRRETAEATGVRITDVADFDLALHHLRVPELV